MSPRSALARLERQRFHFGNAQAQAAKLDALRALARADLRSARAVRQLHELLCWMRAYPDGAPLLAEVERQLAQFHRRADLRRHREALATSGIAGTATHFRFFHAQALWLARRWPRQLVIDRRHDEPEARLARALPLLVSHSEMQSLIEAKLDGFAALDRVRDPHSTDAAFLLERIAAMPGDGFTREAFGDAIDLGFTLQAGEDTPTRTTAFFATAPRATSCSGPRRERPDLRTELARAPRHIRRLSKADGEAAVDLARAAMVLRERSLEAFSYADAGDAWLLDDGEGLAFVFIGVVPERRQTLAAMCGGLTLRHGVPIGYLQADIVGAAAALSFNTFETFRGGEAAYTFARWLAALRAFWGTTSFSIEPYQLGQHNDEALDSGAWWFYAKLGFAPRDATVRALAERERARLARRPGERSSRATLQRLAATHLCFDLDPARPEPLPPQVALGWKVAALLGERAGADREAALERCSIETIRLLGLTSLRGFKATERQAWQRWAPLVALLDLSRWSADERQSLAALIRAKGGRDERAHVRAVQAHIRLRHALRGLTTDSSVE